MRLKRPSKGGKLRNWGSVSVVYFTLLQLGHSGQVICTGWGIYKGGYDMYISVVHCSLAFWRPRRENHH